MIFVKRALFIVPVEANTRGFLSGSVGLQQGVKDEPVVRRARLILVYVSVPVP